MTTPEQRLGLEVLIDAFNIATTPYKKVFVNHDIFTNRMFAWQNKLRLVLKRYKDGKLPSKEKDEIITSLIRAFPKFYKYSDDKTQIDLDRDFFRKSEVLDYWAGVAGYDVDFLRQKFEKALHENLIKKNSKNNCIYKYQ